MIYYQNPKTGEWEPDTVCAVCASPGAMNVYLQEAYCNDVQCAAVILRCKPQNVCPDCLANEIDYKGDERCWWCYDAMEATKPPSPRSEPYVPGYGVDWWSWEEPDVESVDVSISELERFKAVRV